MKKDSGKSDLIPEEEWGRERSHYPSVDSLLPDENIRKKQAHKKPGLRLKGARTTKRVE